MTPAQLLAKAIEYTTTLKGVRYKMGTENWAPDGSGDCSAFLWLCMGEKKRDRNTDWIRADALGAQTKFRAVSQPEPGVIAVYGTRWEKTPSGVTKRHAGHVGVVADVAKKLVVDLSSGQNGIRLHRQPVLLDGPSDRRSAGLIFCVPVVS